MACVFGQTGCMDTGLQCVLGNGSYWRCMEGYSVGGQARCTDGWLRCVVRLGVCKLGCDVCVHAGGVWKATVWILNTNFIKATF